MPSQMIFVIADGAHARFVARAPGGGDFVTLSELDGSDRLRVLRAELRASPPGRSHESMSPSRSSVGPNESVRQAKESFAREVADVAARTFADRARDGVVLVAPQRLIGLLGAGLEGRMTIVGRLGKDLTKIPDHDLGEWLEPLERSARS